MKLSSLIPLIYTNNIQETLDFYIKLLGFECVTNEEAWGWAQLQHDDINIMISKPNAHIPFDKANFTGSFYFNTEHVDELWLKLKDITELCYPIENFDYGMREFAIYDNNGYLLQFGQEI